MRVTRRDFIESSAAIVAASGVLTKPAQAVEGTKLRVCVIGDTKQGGYGHSLHLVWGAREPPRAGGDVEVVGLADPDEEGRRAHASEAKALRTYADYVEMLDKEKPDLVTIGPRWTTRHKEYLMAAVACGAHGLMEKPIASDLGQADEMIRAIEQRNLKWAIAFNFRASPILQHARRLVIEEGLIGEVLELRGRGKEDNRAGGEDLLVLGTHVLDMMRFFMGNALWCAADITVDGRRALKTDVHEATEPLGPVMGDRIQAMYGFPNGVPGFFATTKNAQGNGGRWGLDIYGSKGVVSIRQNGHPKISLLHDPSWAPGDKKTPWEPLPNAPAPSADNDSSHDGGVVERYAPIVDDLVASIREDRKPKVSLQDGRDSLEMIQAVYDAHLHGGRVDLPLKNRTNPLR